MELHESTIDTTRSIWLPDATDTLIAPIGDIQLDPQLRGHPRACDVDRFRAHIDWCVQHNAWFLGMGDYVDPESPSNRLALQRAGLYDSTLAMLDKQSDELELELEEILAPTRNRWLGLLEGHHLHEFEDGTTTDMRLANYLGCPFLGDSALLRIGFPANGHKARAAFDVFATHGQGGGRNGLSKLKQLAAYFTADAYLMGHFHQKEVTYLQRLGMLQSDRRRTPRLIHREVPLMITGSFLRGYMQGSQRHGRAAGNYPEKKLLPPAALGGVELWAQPRYDREGYVSVDLRTSA